MENTGSNSCTSPSSDSTVFFCSVPETNCNRKLTVSTNWPTQLMNPPKKALNGKFPINKTYKNCKPPKATKNAKNESINFNRGVRLRI